MKKNEPKMVGSALRMPRGDNVIPALAIDRDGTQSHDDFFSYVRDGEALVRMTHIVDAPAILRVVHYEVSRAEQCFERDPDGSFLDSSLARRFKRGDVIPAITFETRFDLETKEKIGFRAFASVIRFEGSYSRFDVDCAFDEKNLLITPDPNLLEFIAKAKLDPDLSHLFNRNSGQNFAQDFLSAVLNQANSSALGLARNSGLKLIVHHKDKFGNKTYFLDDGKDHDAILKLTAPMRDFASLVNLAAFSSQANNQLQLFSAIKKADYIDIYNSQSKKKENKTSSEVLAGELDNFIGLIRERNFATAQVILERKPSLAVLAIDEIAINHYGFADPLWEVMRVRDTSISGYDRKYVQVILKREGEILKTPIQSFSGGMPWREVLELACHSFWQRYFSDPDFATPVWRNQPDLSFVKREIEAGRFQETVIPKAARSCQR